jgi:hypothetical protein
MVAAQRERHPQEIPPPAVSTTMREITTTLGI